MARILGAIASSHTPTIGFAYDRNKRDDPAWAPIFAAYEPIQRWLAEKKPDVLFLVYNDHITSFFFDHYSAFALGIGDEYAVADEGGGARALPPIAGAPALAAHVASVLMAEEFDLSVFQKRALDHGVFSPLSMMMPHAPAWPCAPAVDVSRRAQRWRSPSRSAPSSGTSVSRAARRRCSRSRTMRGRTASPSTRATSCTRRRRSVPGSCCRA